MMVEESATNGWKVDTKSKTAGKMGILTHFLCCFFSFLLAL
jgi:hypothetical protein